MNVEEIRNFIISEKEKNVKAKNGDIVAWITPIPAIICNDGFYFSVQAGSVNYCNLHCNTGYIFTKEQILTCEVGYPSTHESLLDPYHLEDNCIFGNVPLEIISEIIIKHGGVKEFIKKLCEIQVRDLLKKLCEIQAEETKNA